MTAGSAGKLSGCGGMICPEGFLQSGFKYLMAFRTDVFHMCEIVSADQNPPGDRHQEPDNERPPDTFDDPEDDGKPLQRRDRKPGQEHHQMQFLQFFLAFHNDGYVTDRLEGEFCFAFQSVFQLTELQKLFLLVSDFI